MWRRVPLGDADGPGTFEAIRLDSVIERRSAGAHAFRFEKDDYFFAVED